MTVGLPDSCDLRHPYPFPDQTGGHGRPVPSERGSDPGELWFSLLLGWFVDIVIGDTIDPQVIVYFSPFHVGVADKLEPELLIIEKPAQPGVSF